jgi:hypothetical protein
MKEVDVIISWQLVSSVEFPVSARVTRKDMVNVSGSTAPSTSILSTIDQHLHFLARPANMR